MATEPQPSNEEKNNAMSAIGIRRLVGYLGILLPILCFGNDLVSQKVLPSISHHIYTPVHGPFTAILCGLGMVLYVYRGYDHWDRWATNIAALAAFGVGLFPTTRSSADQPSLEGLLLVSANTSGDAHNISAIALFVMFFFISGFLFTRRPPADGVEPSFKEFFDALKKTWLFTRAPAGQKDAHEMENAIHRRCAWVILVSIILAYFAPPNQPIPWLAIFETSAILAFAWSWLTKNRRKTNFAKVIAEDVRLAASKAQRKL